VSIRSIVKGTLLTLLLTQSAITNSTPLYFDYVAHVDSSDRPGAPSGSQLTGRFGYDPEQISRQVGLGDYYPERFTAPMIARGSNGFFLELDAQVIVVAPGATEDNMVIQSFVSEHANDWHMVFDFWEAGGEDGWLQGNSSLPTQFPDPLNAPFLSIYFTDDFEWIRTLDATILSVTPAAIVPLPSAVILFCQSLLILSAAIRAPTTRARNTAWRRSN